VKDWSNKKSKFNLQKGICDLCEFLAIKLKEKKNIKSNLRIILSKSKKGLASCKTPNHHKVQKSMYTFSPSELENQRKASEE